jgi:hypothetical protein
MSSRITSEAGKPLRWNKLEERMQQDWSAFRTREVYNLRICPRMADEIGDEISYE